MGDPRLITPDVVSDFTSIQLEQDGPDRVRVFGIRAARTDKSGVHCYKARLQGVGTWWILWPEAARKQMADRVSANR